MKTLNTKNLKLKTKKNLPKIFLASDHAGFELKDVLIDFLISLDYEVSDQGAFEYDEQDDYPDFISKVAKKVSENPRDSKGIILGGSGQGEAIVANRFPDVRAVVYYGVNLEIIKLSRQHNDANILSLGARFLSEEEAKNSVELWLKTDFSGEERHQRRIDKIESSF
ncbi:RpiB/LacA/LacB family sugar-phosphate isomerase [Patescibacteria group bacterium]|nr:RpiB/LacA/LacB family sugar-phosphate isomerase [Patescibacteria group bacterium]MCG2694862.1 RpiB/LacA/LacB family sugar-phosphate isomerase [Candidatus Parcubacteria bacterium]